MSRKRVGQCEAEAIDDDSTHFCVLDSYHPGLAHKTSEGWFFGGVMDASADKDLEVLHKIHRDIVMHGVDVGVIMGLKPGELNEIIKGTRKAELPVQPPPWVVFSYGDNKETADILPAGRPGRIIEKLPRKLAEVIVKAANKWKP